MVEMVGRHPNIYPYLHLPVQSGSDAVLRRMARGYTVAEYRRLAMALRDARPDLALSTDIIVGFPGETEQEFQATMELVAELRFSSVFAFKYSPRPGTAAPRLEGAVSTEIADRRLQELLGLQQGIQQRLNRRLEGEVFDVLVTGWGREASTQTGRTPCHRIVHFPVEEGRGSVLGEVVPVVIERGNPHSLIGRRPVVGS
jgi:tRNA-2-methylthio-N6-dimethylallyladenosine synthase